MRRAYGLQTRWQHPIVGARTPSARGPTFRRRSSDCPTRTPVPASYRNFESTQLQESLVAPSSRLSKRNGRSSIETYMATKSHGAIRTHTPRLVEVGTASPLRLTDSLAWANKPGAGWQVTPEVVALGRRIETSAFCRLSAATELPNPPRSAHLEPSARFDQ